MCTISSQSGSIILNCNNKDFLFIKYLYYLSIFDIDASKQKKTFCFEATKVYIKYTAPENMVLGIFLPLWYCWLHFLHILKIKIRLFSSKDIVGYIYGNRLETVSPCACVTWDICGRRLISLRLTACGSRLLSSWHSSTPSLRAWARSQTWAHTQQIRRRSWRRRLGSLQVCNRMKQPSHLCTLPCYPVVVRKDSTVDQPRRTLSPQLHLCFLHRIQKDRWVRELVSQHEYFRSRNG